MSYKFNLFTYFICHEKYLAEFFGTLFLVLLACGSAVLVGPSAGAALLYRFWSLGLANGFNFGGITDISGNYLATNVCQPGVSQGMALLCEILLTMFFVLVILGATDAKKGYGNFAGLAIGLALGLVNIVGIPVDNCSVNPARSFGPALFSPNAWGDFWIMVVGPLAGALLAVFIWKSLVAAKKGK